MLLTYYLTGVKAISDVSRPETSTESPNYVDPLGYFGLLPMEILDDILSWSSTAETGAAGSSLYAMTRVSKSMAELALPKYIKANEGFLPTLADFHIRLRKDSFMHFPAWVRSSMFAPRDNLVCYFSSPDIERKINAVRVGLGSLQPENRPKSITYEGDLNLMQALSLFEVAMQARTEIVEVEVYHLDWSSPQNIEDRTVYKLGQTVKLGI